MASKRTRKITVAKMDTILGMIKNISDSPIAVLELELDAEFEASFNALIKVPLDIDIDIDIDINVMPPSISKTAADPVPVVSSWGTQKISIRVPRRTLDAFKAQAHRCGTQYQSLIVKTLNAASRGWGK